MFALRDYQLEAIEAIEAAWSGGINRPAVVLSTGAGKTVVFASLIDRHIERLRKGGLRVLVLAHREELLEQAEAKIKATVPGVWTSVVKGSRGATTHQFADVIVASVQTLARPKRREVIDRIGMIIVDECHLSVSPSWRTVLEHYGCFDDRATPTVGFTATLTRMDGGLPDVWQSVAYQRRIHWFIKQGFLVPPVAKSIEVPGLNLSTVRILGGDLDAKGVAAALEESAAFEIMAEQWHAHAADRPTIAFMPNVATCEALAVAVRATGATAEVVTGNTVSTDRKASYARFESGATGMLISVNVLSTGFDAPHTSCVLLGRPTKSPALYIQMLGRALRLHPQSGKTDALILDLAGASLTHNLAGVNDLESDCESQACDCNCLSCGCNTSCKCAKRQCGCRCIEQHQSAGPNCKCAGSDECGCGCPGDAGAEGMECLCEDNPDCECRSGVAAPETKELDGAVLRTLTDVDILGTELAKSSYQWLTTTGGIKFLVIGQDTALFLLPAPDGNGYFQGRLEGFYPNGKVTRLDGGAVPVVEARDALEDVADRSGYTYSDKGASWRRTPASDAQLSLLERLQVELPPLAPGKKLRKGDAGDLISVAKLSRALDPRFAKYVQPQQES